VGRFPQDSGTGCRGRRGGLSRAAARTSCIGNRRRAHPAEGTASHHVWIDNVWIGNRIGNIGIDNLWTGLGKPLGRTNFNLYRSALSFASLGERSTHSLSKALRLYTEARFEQAFGDGKGIVKFGLAGKITHAKAIEPIERAWAALAIHDNFDTQLLGIHAKSVTL